MAGIIGHTGSADPVFTFRYQYLLIEVGTNILRTLFDHQVGPGNFKQYLDNHTGAKKQLLFLINKKQSVITTEQQQLLPPIDNNPSSSNFDITLLCCLLRNACGLRVCSDTVWTQPSSTDTSIEALIARFRLFRNELMRSGTVFDSATDLNAKWKELCSILTGLGNFCGMTNLHVQSLIDKAEKVEIDEKLKEQFDNMMSAWSEMDHRFREVELKVDYLEEKVEATTTEQQRKIDKYVKDQETFEQKVETITEEQQKKIDECVKGQETLEKKVEVTTEEQQKKIDECVKGQETFEKKVEVTTEEQQKKIDQCVKDQATLKQKVEITTTEQQKKIDQCVKGQETFEKKVEVTTEEQQKKIDQCVKGQETFEKKVEVTTEEQQKKIDECVKGQETFEKKVEVTTKEQQKKIDQCVKGQETLAQKLEKLERQNTNTQLASSGQTQNKQKQPADEVMEESDQLQCLQHVDFRRVVDKNWSLLLQHLNPTSTLDAFGETEYISTIQSRDISELPTTSAKIRKILDIVKTKGQKGYDDFKDCLRKSDQEYLVQLLEDTEIAMADGLDVHMERLMQIIQSRVKNTDIQQQLIDVYQTDCFRLPMSPLLKDENQELLKIYKMPSLSVVDYHKAKPDQTSTEVKSCKEIFYEDDQQCRNIYLTGDAGVGKSSFCMYLSLLWSMSRKRIKVSNDRMQKDADFLTKFEYLFYVTLRDTACTDVIAMIVDQLFNTESEEKWNTMYTSVENVLKCNECLVILDGLDEWSSTRIPTDKQVYKIPHRPTLRKCTFLTSCRPYKIEYLRLVQEELDRQVKMTGLHGSSMKSYIADIVKHINEKYDENKNADDFVREAEQCRLHELLCIPIITSNLVMVWLDQPLTNMSRTLIYGNNVEMLFKIAKDRNIEFPSTSSSSSPGVQLPDSLSDLEHFREHFSLLEKVCLLSFRSLFKQDDCVTSLIFTPQQLMSEPYFMSSNEQDFLCKIGILSKNKVTRRFGKQEHKLNFLHQSYLEFFAAIFVSSFDVSELLNICNNLTTVGDVLQFGNFFQFLAGCSPRKLELVFGEIHRSISDELTSWRTNAIFDNIPYSYRNKINSLHKTVINCFKECCICSHEDVNLRHEHFVFGGNYDVEYMKRLLLFNNVKYIQSMNGEYLDEFKDIKTLECLHVCDLFWFLHESNLVYDVKYLGESNFVYDEKFNELMVQNASTLHSVCIQGSMLRPIPLISDIPVGKLHHLTSLGLHTVNIHHNSMHNLVTFMSNNVKFAHIQLCCVSCNTHRDNDSECTFTLQLQNHSQLASLNLQLVPISCNYFNNSNIKYIALQPLSERIARSYDDLFKCMDGSKIEVISICGRKMLDNYTIKTLTTALRSLSRIKRLDLFGMTFPNDVSLLLGVSQVDIFMCNITMSCPCFHCLIDSCVNRSSMTKVRFLKCHIISVDGDTHRHLSEEESVKYMSKYLTPIPTINITHKSCALLDFETTNYCP